MSSSAREEDPSFTIKTMLVQTQWPGATVDDTMLQVTDRIEKKLQETPWLYYLKSLYQARFFNHLRERTRQHAKGTNTRNLVSGS